MSGPKVLVLYRVVNSKDDKGSSGYNCFEMPRSGVGGGVTLANVKKYGRALSLLSPSAGSDGYHWRIRVDDKPPPNSSTSKTFSWWDIQDENARLPIQEKTMSQLQKMMSAQTKMESPSSSGSSSSSNDAVVKAASSTMRSLGKAMNKVVAEATNSGIEDSSSSGPRICVICFKLLNLVQLHSEYNNASSFAPKRRQPPPRTVSSAPKTSTTTVLKPNQQQPQQLPRRRPAQQGAATTVPRIPPVRSATVPPPSAATAASTRRSVAPQAQASLMDFGPAPTSNTLHHSVSSPLPTTTTTINSNETRAERLKREYAKKQQTENRVWDEVDQRWVTVNTKNGATVQRGSTSAPPGTSTNAIDGTTKKMKGISLENTSTAGKSAHVAQKMAQRANDMKQAQAQALQEVREREMQKKQNEAREDVIRQQLDPKLKAWSEEHGKKKQLRALLSSLHTILWDGAKWKPVSLGDILDDSKVKRCFHKASRVVHPDKTMDLDPEKRFLAKRIFDALSQAKAQFDEGKN